MNMKNILKSVDFKGLAIQHCEKAAIVVVTALLVMFLLNGVKKAMSASDITPDQIAQLADKLTTSVRNSVWESSPDRDLIKNPPFEADIQKLMTGIDSNQFKLSPPYFFNFVDFGGFLRQKPDILTPYNPIAFADKGAVSLYQLDAKGNFKEVEKVIRTTPKKKEKEEEPKKKTKQAVAKSGPKGGKGAAGMSMSMSGMGGMNDDMADSSSGGMMMSGMGGMGRGGMGMAQGRGASSDGSDSEEMMGNIGASQTKKSGGTLRRNIPKQDDDDVFADEPPPGKAGATPVGPGEKATKTPVTRKVKVEEIRGIRWAVITALVRHREQVKEYAKKLHTPEDPPVYRMVKVERREVLSDGSLSDWASIDLEKEAEIVKVLPEKRRTPELAELVAANAVFERLIMPLPELVAGKWRFCNQKAASDSAKAVSSQVAAGRGMGAGAMDGSEEEETSQDELNEQLFGGGQGPSGRPGMAGADSSMGVGRGAQGGYSGGGQEMSKSMAGGATAQRGGGQAGARSGSIAGGGSGTAKAQSGTAKAQLKVQRSNAEIVQIRFVDYTVEPEHTYQYRLKVVVQNPNFNRMDIISDDVAADETLTSEDWSEPTLPVYVPTDAEYFVIDRIKNREEAKLQVHKWLADLGDWQFSDFTMKPGDPIGGEVRDYKMVDWEDKLKTTKFDFSTEDLLLDVTGGDKSFTFIVDGVEIKYNEKLPAEIFVLDRLGDLATRTEDFDKHNVDRKERETAISTLRKEAKDKEEKEPGKKGSSNKPEAGGSEGFEERVPTRKAGG